MLKRASLWLSLVALALSVMAISAQEDPFRLTILHTNDTHSNHAPLSNGNGGVARQATVQQQVAEEGGNVVLLDGGDRFTGTLFHTVYVGTDQVQIMNALGYDAMALGNHEFDNGDEPLLNFLEGITFPALSANIDLTEFAELDALVDQFTILEVNGQQVGVIGLTTADTPEISSPNASILFNSDSAAVVNQYALELTEMGVNKIVVLSHTGINVDLAVIPMLQNVDVWIGGHSHTLMSNIYKSAAAAYPAIVDDADGNPIYYAQAGQYNEYLGRLDVTFDAEGLITAATGDTILLSRYIAPDAELAAIVEELSGPVAELRDQPINATTDRFLEGDRTVCRIEQCDMGTVIADAMRDATGAQIALMNSGGVRASMEAGDIVLGEVLTVQPFGNTIATFESTGADIRAALENSVSRIALNAEGLIERDGGSGRFLQISGIRFSYDPKAEAGSRVVSVEVLGEDGTYAPLDDAAIYSVVTNNFVRTGGDGFTMFNENAINAYDFCPVDYEVTSAYLAKISPLGATMDAEDSRITAVDTEVEPR